MVVLYYYIIFVGVLVVLLLVLLWFVSHYATVVLSDYIINLSTMAEIDWVAINAKLPHKKTAEEKAARKMMFQQFDPNGNGILSLAEVDKAMRDVLNMGELFDAKPAIMRAFQIAKNCTKSSRGKQGDDYIEFREFRYFLQALRQYFEYWVAFCRTDTDGDRRIDLQEFKAARDKLEVWVGPIDCEAAFSEIDTNKGGHILFDEFCQWAITKNLDLEDDVDED